MKIENIYVYNFFNAIYAIRNAHKSWDKADSNCLKQNYPLSNIFFSNNEIKNTKIDFEKMCGKKDLELCIKLIKAGTEHRKFLRQILFNMNITAPLYFWRQFDTYKIGITQNSTSTMHCILKSKITIDDFNLTDIEDKNIYDDVIAQINFYIKYKDKIKNVIEIISQILPSGYLQMRTITGNYENLLNILSQRKKHKLSEWHKFCDIILNEFPFLDIFFNALKNDVI
jgi:hypothetical protein